MPPAIIMGKKKYFFYVTWGQIVSPTPLGNDRRKYYHTWEFLESPQNQEILIYFIFITNLGKHRSNVTGPKDERKTPETCYSIEKYTVTFI